MLTKNMSFPFFPESLVSSLNRVAKNCATHPILTVPIPGGQFHCLALSQTCPNSRMMGVLLSAPWKKTSGKKTCGGLLVSLRWKLKRLLLPLPKTSATNRRCWDYAAIHTWFLVLSWTLAGWRDLTTDRFPGCEKEGNLRSGKPGLGKYDPFTTRLFSFFCPLHSFAIVSLRIPDFRWSNLFNFGSYTQTVYEAATSFGWSRLTALRQGTDTHNSCAYLEISWFSIGRMEEARPHMPYTQTHTCITVVLYLDIIQKSHVYDLCGCFFFFWKCLNISPIFGRLPGWPIFFRWLEATKYMYIMYLCSTFILSPGRPTHTHN